MRYRPAGIGKRPPQFAQGKEAAARYAALSKADWADAYLDLYRQCFGETTPDEEALGDAERRTATLRRAR